MGLLVKVYFYPEWIIISNATTTKGLESRDPGLTVQTPVCSKTPPKVNKTILRKIKNKIEGFRWREINMYTD